MSFFSPKSEVAVGPLQFQCLVALWKLGPSTVHAITDELNKERAKRPAMKPIAYTTVLTVCRNLVSRKICSRVEGGRAHTYKANRNRDEFHSEMARQFLGDYFGGNVKNLIDALGDSSRPIASKVRK